MNSFVSNVPEFSSPLLSNFSSVYNFFGCFGITKFNSNNSEKHNFNSYVLRVFQQSYSIVLLLKMSENTFARKCHCLFFKLGSNGKYIHRSFFFANVHLVTFNKITFGGFLCRSSHH